MTDDHIDAMLAGPIPVDLIGALALPIPSLVISQLLGVPYDDAPLFQEHANADRDVGELIRGPPVGAITTSSVTLRLVTVLAA